MWRREMIRLVLACNWIVAGFSFMCAVYGHGHLWGMNCGRMAQEDIPYLEDEKADVRGIEDAQSKRRDEYKQRTNWVGESGQRGWWVACLTSAGTAVLLMIAFPKKPPS